MQIKGSWKDKSGIYCINNNNTNKKYIGSSINIQGRLMKHRSLLRNNKHENILLQNTWNKHSEKSFECYILEYVEKDLLQNREQFYIDNLNSGYNLMKDVIRLGRTKEMNLQQSETRLKLFSDGLLKPNCSKKIDVYNLRGEFLRSFPTIKETYTTLNVARSAITQNLNGQTRSVHDYIFIHDRDLTLKDLIFPTKGKNILILGLEDKNIYFRSINSCASFINENRESISLFLSRTKRELFKNKYKIDLIKSCELLETLEADNQQPSDIEIY